MTKTWLYSAETMLKIYISAENSIFFPFISNIDRIHTEFYSWRSRESIPAAQIDLIIDRADNLTNVCEIKYSQLPYSISKDEEARIRNRIADFVAETNIRSGILPTMITTFGIRSNAHSSIAQICLTMDDLFQ